MSEIVDEFKRSMKVLQAADLFKNPLLTDRSSDIASKVLQWNSRLRASAYITGDSYHGMLVSEFKELISEEGFIISHEDDFVFAMVHSDLEIAGSCFFEGDRVDNADICFDLPIIYDPASIAVLSSIRVKVPSSNSSVVRVRSTVDVSCGFRVKMHVLKSCVSAYSESD